MQQSVNYITKEKKEELLRELEDLKGPKRRESIDNIESAKALGDLSENAEYHQAREDQGKLEERILKIESILRDSQIVSDKRGDIVEVGSTVIVQKENTKENKTYIVVGSEEADSAGGKISNRSPFGEALFGKKKGDNVTFKTPTGMVNYIIVEVK
ncbi:MAG: transcription elongation factor GreA [Candidatus Nomurabacteria bacterium]|nr:transcription elongation factor GreA [Candidatus Nomurabacteria bacterium]